MVIRRIVGGCKSCKKIKIKNLMAKKVCGRRKGNNKKRKINKWLEEKKIGKEGERKGREEIEEEGG